MNTAQLQYYHRLLKAWEPQKPHLRAKRLEIAQELKGLTARRRAVAGYTKHKKCVACKFINVTEDYCGYCSYPPDRRKVMEGLADRARSYNYPIQNCRKCAIEFHLTNDAPLREICEECDPTFYDPYVPLQKQPKVLKWLK